MASTTTSLMPGLTKRISGNKVPWRTAVEFALEALAPRARSHCPHRRQPVQRQSAKKKPLPRL